MTEEKNPPTPFQNTVAGGGETCRASMKMGGIGWEAACIQKAWNYGPEDLTGGRAETQAFSLPWGSAWMITQQLPAVSQRMVFLNGRRNSGSSIELVHREWRGFSLGVLEGMGSEAQVCHSSKVV